MDLIGDSRFQMNLSVALVLEYEDVLKRTESTLLINDNEIDTLLNFYCGTVNLREIFYLWRPTLRDPEDDFLLELAVESGAEYIVTFNLKDFAGCDRFGVKALRPNQFLEIIGEMSWEM